ncbi:MAG: RNA repair domain-containing protein [Methanophagales archaeon]|nr:RNA repair domain-containing protein [Methanophagales archaeon]MCW3141987.1 RNA repair domain-containing protein [Methanophagales archaeon]
MKVREILNRVKWDERMDFDQLEVVYLHRGAPDDLKRISGREVVHIGKSFLSLNEAEIPHHRIVKILYEGEVLFERGK